MKRLFLLLFVVLFVSPVINAKEVAVTMFKLKPEGLANSIGVVVARDTADGLELKPYLQGLPPGTHHFNVHENVGCGSQYNPDGSAIMGMAAGSVYKQISSLEVDDQGMATRPVIMPGSRLTDISGRTLVIAQMSPQDMHQRGMAMGGQRIACGSLELY